MKASYPVSVALAEAINHLNELLKKEANTDFSYTIRVHGNKVAASTYKDGLITPLSKTTKPKDLGATISFEEIRHGGSDGKYKHIRIEVPIPGDHIGDEYELNFPVESTEEAILNTPLHYWRII